eukprot:gi/632985569/ref/XP_007909755.1/ PREDICTED: prostaglandin E2 receptor EP1 subtype [Callorhinchus milii]
MTAEENFNLTNNQTEGTSPLGVGSGSSAASMAMPIFSMTLGILSNIVALVILVKSYSRFRRRTKATFLLFASSLVLTDFAGHLIPGALVLHQYSTVAPRRNMGSSSALCQFFGACMVFFGLCPLFLGCVMAVERCVGVTRPLLHSSVVTTARTKLAVVSLWTVAVLISLLPSMGFGRYSVQWPNTWCFIRVPPFQPGSWLDSAFAIIFSLLGLASLLVSMVCNTISGVTLVQARLRKKTCNRKAKSHDIEMVVQLVGIMMVSCICWSPLLCFVLIAVCSRSHDQQEKRILLGVHLASWNQILDPWVYILLRRAVMRKVYKVVVRRSDLNKSMFDRWEISSFQSSDRSVVSRF